MAKRLIVGNWKMNPVSQKEAISIFSNISKVVSKLKKTEAVIAAPFVYLGALKKTNKKPALASQDLFFEYDGAYTGKISPKMVKDCGATYAIIGHSEVRAQGETDEMVNRKIKAALKIGISPIVCVGESERDDNGFFHSKVKDQILHAFEGISKASLLKISIAYEPIWAIGVNAKREATPAESEEMVIYIRKVLSDIYDAKSAKSVRMLYGGSVNPKNAGYFLLSGGVEGLLVGRDSLDPKKFQMILMEAERLPNTI